MIFETVLYLYEVPPSHVARQVIGARTPRSWLKRLDDESLDVVEPDEIESWVSQDLLKKCASVEPVSELDHCHIGMNAIVMGDVKCRIHTRVCSPPTVACCAH